MLYPVATVLMRCRQDKVVVRVSVDDDEASDDRPDWLCYISASFVGNKHVCCCGWVADETCEGFIVISHHEITICEGCRLTSSLAARVTAVLTG